MPIPRGTRQFVGLSEIAERTGLTYGVVRYWWREGRLIGRMTEGAARPRVAIPVEVLEFYLHYARLPTKLELYEADALTREFLLELNGPDGGFSELEPDAVPDRDSETARVA